MVVSESGSSDALTRSAIGAGGITIVDEANQKQDIVTLNRDTSNLNGTVDKLPDLQNALASQSDLIDAAQAAAETIAKQAGKYAEKKQKQAQEAANAETDPERKAQYEREAASWAEGGKNRIALHAAGGALTGGLTGGGMGAVRGAAGAGVSATLAPKFDRLTQSMKEAGPTGNSDVDEMLGNLASNLLAGGVGALVGGPTGALTSAASDRFNRQLHQREYDDAKRHAKTVAKELGISEQEAEGRIVAEILRNSDKQTAQASGGKHDYEVRSIVGCQNLNCDGYKNDPQYANHDYNSQYIKPNRVSYDHGQGQLGSGMTDAELRQENLPYERAGKLALTGIACVLSGGVACKAAATGLGTSALFNFATDKPLSSAEAIGGLYGGAIGGIYGANLRLWAGEANAWFEKAILGGTKLVPAFAGKQAGVPVGNSTELGRSVDPLFDPASNPWWGYQNVINQIKGGDQ
jgi:filamentous hemagglutinin